MLIPERLLRHCSDSGDYASDYRLSDYASDFGDYTAAVSAALDRLPAACAWSDPGYNTPGGRDMVKWRIIARERRYRFTGINILPKR